MADRPWARAMCRRFVALDATADVGEAGGHPMARDNPKSAGKRAATYRRAASTCRDTRRPIGAPIMERRATFFPIATSRIPSDLQSLAQLTQAARSETARLSMFLSANQARFFSRRHIGRGTMESSGGEHSARHSARRGREWARGFQKRGHCMDWARKMPAEALLARVDNCRSILHWPLLRASTGWPRGFLPSLPVRRPRRLFSVHSPG